MISRLLRRETNSTATAKPVVENEITNKTLEQCRTEQVVDIGAIGETQKNIVKPGENNECVAVSDRCEQMSSTAYIKVSIPTYRVRSSYVEYVIICHKDNYCDISCSSAWRVFRRYQQFKILDSKLRELSERGSPHHSEYGVLPVLPRSHWMEVTNQSPELVDKRRRYLEVYLQQLLITQNQFYSRKTALYNFLHEGKVYCSAHLSSIQPLLGINTAAEINEKEENAVAADAAAAAAVDDHDHINNIDSENKIRERSSSNNNNDESDKNNYIHEKLEVEEMGQEENTKLSSTLHSERNIYRPQIVKEYRHDKHKFNNDHIHQNLTQEESLYLTRESGKKDINDNNNKHTNKMENIEPLIGADTHHSTTEAVYAHTACNNNNTNNNNNNNNILTSNGEEKIDNILMENYECKSETCREEEEKEQEYEEEFPLDELHGEEDFATASESDYLIGNEHSWLYKDGLTCAECNTEFSSQHKQPHKCYFCQRQFCHKCINHLSLRKPCYETRRQRFKVHEESNEKSTIKETDAFDENNIDDANKTSKESGGAQKISVSACGQCKENYKRRLARLTESEVLHHSGIATNSSNNYSTINNLNNNNNNHYKEEEEIASNADKRKCRDLTIHHYANYLEEKGDIAALCSPALHPFDSPMQHFSCICDKSFHRITDNNNEKLASEYKLPVSEHTRLTEYNNHNDEQSKVATVQTKEMENGSIQSASSNENGSITNKDNNQLENTLATEDVLPLAQCNDITTATIADVVIDIAAKRSTNDNDNNNNNNNSDEDNNNSSKEEVVSEQSFDLLTVLGQGMFGKVIKVRYIINNKLYAMKVLNKSVVYKRCLASYLKEERAILLSLPPHPYIVRCHFAFQSDYYLFFIFDYLPGGELYDRIYPSLQLTSNDVELYAAELVLALEHIHSHEIVHRDLKPENILLDAEGHIHLTDFGLARSHICHTRRRSFVGSPEYVSPEIIQGEIQSTAIDWWSFGVLLYEMICGHTPFHAGNNEAVYHNVMEGNIDFTWTNKVDKVNPFSEQAIDLIRRLLCREVKYRLQEPEAIKSHPYFGSVDWEALMSKKIIAHYIPNTQHNDTRYFKRRFTMEWAKMPNAAKLTRTSIAALNTCFNTFPHTSTVNRELSTHSNKQEIKESDEPINVADLEKESVHHTEVKTLTTKATTTTPTPLSLETEQPTSIGNTNNKSAHKVDIITWFAKDVKHKLCGVWRLIKVETCSLSDHRVICPWGGEVGGMLIYLSNNTYSMQLCTTPCISMNSKATIVNKNNDNNNDNNNNDNISRKEDTKCKNKRLPSCEEILREIFASYVASFGTYQIDERQRCIVHLSEGNLSVLTSSKPLRLKYCFESNSLLTLTSAPARVLNETFLAQTVMLWQLDNDMLKYENWLHAKFMENKKIEEDYNLPCNIQNIGFPLY